MASIAVDFQQRFDMPIIRWIFWNNGITCIYRIMMIGVVIIITVRPDDGYAQDEDESDKNRIPH